MSEVNACNDSKGITRERAYKLVQRNAMQVWKTNEDFEVVLNKDKEIKKYLSNKVKACDFNHALKKTILF